MAAFSSLTARPPSPLVDSFTYSLRIEDFLLSKELSTISTSSYIIETRPILRLLRSLLYFPSSQNMASLSKSRKATQNLYTYPSSLPLENSPAQNPLPVEHLGQ
jgi:hypothetical protein